MASRLKECFDMFAAPRATVDLMYGRVQEKDPFYARVTEEFYREAMKFHPRFPLIGRLQFGVALCVLPSRFEDYFMAVEAAARRNFKKARRNGYTLQRINYNDFLGDIDEIRKSAEVRQGRMPSDYLEGIVQPCKNPMPQTSTHDYPYFGVLREGKLVAYAGCMIAGELAIIEHIFGHAAHQSDGVVPMLLIGMAESILANYPYVKYYGYGSYFGASETLRRFKRKFCFTPHHVKWMLELGGGLC